MSRRSTPERLSYARRSATLERLVSAGMLRDRAEAALAAWERRTEGEAQGPAVRDWGAAYRELRDQL